MGKNVLVILVALAVVIGYGRTSFAMDMCGTCDAGDAKAEAAGNASAAQNVGNKFCPVTGEPVDGKTTLTYNGKAYNFCCPMCIGTFKKDPVKYSAIAEKDAAGTGNAAEHHHH